MRPAGAAPPPPPPSPYAPPPSTDAEPTAYVAGRPAYAPYASQPVTPADTQPPGVDVDFRREVLARSSRLTVGFRLVLAIPHLLVVWALGYAVLVVEIVAWFAALFTARVPDGIYGFLAWVVRYHARVWTYLVLLTDRWPTFGESADDPVVVGLPGSLRLNRAAVLFRLVLLVPVAFAVGVLSLGLVVAGPFIWLLVLVRGRVPVPVFDATASTVRYATRYYAYAALLTARYPGGLYGDPDVDDVRDEHDGASAPRMTRAARRIVLVLIAAGVIGLAGLIAILVVLGRAEAKRQQADNDFTDAYQSLHLTSLQTCAGNSDPIGCATEAARQNASALRTFEADVSAIDFPSGAALTRDVAGLRASTDAFIDDFDALSRATSPTDYARVASTTDIATDATAFDHAVEAVSVDLQPNQK